ncbi:ABC transporter ATPase [Burkholderia sp. MSh2]|uniref:ABC transporter ATPase n=1 Tax=Burkholderia paludis TaxID=1506587 RepID=A0A6J5DBA2_9BURK|nr:MULTISPECIES: BMA_0021/BMA_0022 family TOMM bacteriocin [Burkholderia]KEZ01237.1 ABC transporter ATPase [Burkholderia sp. MSh2]KFG92405.1 ABC transporter ATPase [Burkholderia paludis]CAB3750677.1 hypothetical protein LMG30113_01266 [Burkholderia paludis]VWB10934.1 ABC transporter ATPase [Burkholderia paludis]
MAQNLRSPTYEEFLEYRAVIIEAIALAWHSPVFLEALETDPIQALSDQFQYDYPFQIDLQVKNDTSRWTPDVNGGWTTLRNNRLTLVLPPAPEDLSQYAQALAAYNANHIDILDRQ